MHKPSILFMGTPEFAVPSLKILIDHRMPLAGVVTQPDRPRGRGRQLAPPPVKILAEAHGLSVLQPGKNPGRGVLQFRTRAEFVVVPPREIGEK